MYKPLCLLVLLCTALNAVYAQVAVQGKILDASNNQPVPNASLFSPHQFGTTQTDTAGNFSCTVSRLPDSIYISCAGYHHLRAEVNKRQLVLYLSPDFASLREIVVSGSREQQLRTEIPAALDVVSRATINDTRATRLDLLLNKIPGVNMVDLGNEQHEMAVRQPLGTHSLFLYLEDGIPIRTTGDFNHNALIEINQASLDRIEVTRGPASSLFGSEAVGGAINFITQSPTPLLTAKLQAELGSRGYKRTDVSLANTSGKLGFFAGGYFASQNQAADQHNDFQKAALTLRADYALAPGLKLTTVGDYINYQTDQKGGLDSLHFYEHDYQSSYRITYRKVDALRIRSTLAKNWHSNSKTSLTGFYRHSAIAQNPFYAITNIPGNSLKAKGQENEDAFQSYGTVLQHSIFLPAKRVKITAGLSADYSPAGYFARFTTVDRNSTGVYDHFTPTDSLLTHYKVQLFNSAAFAQGEWQVLENLRLVAAARYDRLDYHFHNYLSPGAFTGAPDASDHFDHFTPKLGATWNFRKTAGTYLNYSVGFAPPNITDLYTGVKVPLLKASSYHNYEAGAWLSFAANKGIVEISVYRMSGRNEIVSTRLADGSYENRNAGKTTHKGVELNIRYAPVASVSLHIAATYANHIYLDYIELGKNYSGNQMAQAPHYLYNAELTYKPESLRGLRLGLELQGMSRYFTNPQNTATYTGYTVFNARAGYQLKAVEVWLNCLNAANSIYATVVEKNDYGTSYRPGQLRSFNAGIAYNFRKK